MKCSLSMAILAACAAFLCGCSEPHRPTVAPPPVLPNLAPLGKAPDWAALEKYQRTITRDEFHTLLETHYCLPLAWRPHIEILDDRAEITRDTANPDKGKFVLHFASGPLPAPAVGRYWRFPQEIPASTDAAKPLTGRKIVIDPGHIGGEWSKMEERHFHPDKNRPPVREGTHTLQTARILKGLLEASGATVVLLREKEEPVTPRRPDDFMAEARAELTRMGLDPDRPAPDAPPQHYPKWQAEKLFYRTAEIRARAELVNETIRPDVVLCLHYDAAAWGSGGTFTDENHLHMLLSGGFAMDEVMLDDQRSEMLTELLERTHEAEIPLATAVGTALAAATGLPPRKYSAGAVAIPNQPYLWARNLLANRLYRCPVAFCEPYAMNNRDVYERLLAGDYDGVREINGASRNSIFREYAQAVAKGVADYFSAAKGS